MKRLLGPVAAGCVSGLVWFAPVLRAQMEIEVEPPRGDGERIRVPAPADKTAAGAKPGAAADKGAADAVDKQKDVVEFLNKDKLQGTLVAVAPGDFGLRWKHSSVAKPIDFSLEGVSSIRLAKRSSQTMQGAGIRLTNGDLLVGNIVSLDADKLVLDTPYAGKVNIKRSMLRTVNPSSATSMLVYEGPTDMSGWVMNHNAGQQFWKFKNNSLYSLHQYPIGRFIDNLPDVADIQFEAGWKAYPSFTFGFCTSTVDPNAGYGNCYWLRVSGSSVYLQRYSRERGTDRNLVQIEVPRFGNNTCSKAKFGVLFNKKEQRLVLMIDDKVERECQDADGFIGSGNGIFFQSHNQGNLKISNVRVSQWDGKTAKPTIASSELKEDLICLANNDRVSGKLKGIGEGKVKMETSYAMMDVPIERITEIQMATDGSERARRVKNDIRGRFAARGEVTMELVRIEQNTVEGRSENYGTITMPLDAFRHLEFNIYQDREKDEEDDAAF